MFRRVDSSSLPDKDLYLKDPNYHKAVSFYTKSYELEEQGNIKGYMNKYLLML